MKVYEFKWVLTQCGKFCGLHVINLPKFRSARLVISFTLKQEWAPCSISLRSLVPCCGVRFSTFGTSANVWPIVAVPDDGSWWLWSSRWTDGSRTRSTLTGSGPLPFFQLQIITVIQLGWNACRRDGKPATKHLSYCTAYSLSFVCLYVSLHEHCSIKIETPWRNMPFLTEALRMIQFYYDNFLVPC
jgi:hypothetical protein